MSSSHVFEFGRGPPPTYSLSVDETMEAADRGIPVEQYLNIVEGSDVRTVDDLSAHGRW